MLLKRQYAGTVDERKPTVDRLRAVEQELARARAARDAEDVKALLVEQRALRDTIRVTGVKVTQCAAVQRLSPAWLDGGAKEGWLERRDGRVILHRVNGDDLVYVVAAEPGTYCCHCNDPMGDSGTAQEHIALAHAGEPSPDPQNPSGYRVDSGYTLVLEADAFDVRTPAEVATDARGVRDELARQLRDGKYADTRGTAAQRRQLQQAAAATAGG